MFSSAKVLCLNIFILLTLIWTIKCDCQVETPVDIRLRPTFYKLVGTHKIKMNLKNNNVLYLHDAQEIEAHCDLNFEYPEAHKLDNKINIKCLHQSLEITSGSFKNRYYNRVNVQCGLSRWNLYESSNNFDWCPFNVISYILARSRFFYPPNDDRWNYLAGICYDIYNSAFYSVYYTLTPNKSENAHPSVFGSSFLPKTPINHIGETFGSNSILANVFNDVQFENWITNLKYDFSSIIQHQKLHHTFSDEFATLLEFIWWPNLRLYNWKRYINALEEHVQNDHETYDILAGVSGAIKVPITKNCQKNYTMEEVVLNNNRKVPLYVWNYLQNTLNSTNEFVIIGFNSPFNEFYLQDDIIFCPDICNEISWLKDVSSSFHYNVMGTVFCCTVDDVRASQLLDGFPVNDMKPQPIQETTTEEQTESTSINDTEYDE